jgi:rSAM/selenodomain-associated transferase 2
LKGLLSIIIPTINQQNMLVATLQSLQPLRALGHEIIVVDGGSVDNSCYLATPLADQVLVETGKARQMNVGARAARGKVLVFLYADTCLPAYADFLILAGLVSTKRRWGRFDVRLSGKAPLLRMVEFLMNWRSRLTGITTGEHAMFMQRSLYFQVQGFPDIPVMEDIALSRHLRRFGRPVCIAVPVISSSQGWEQKGIIRTVLLRGSLRLAFRLGINPQRLASYYK